jgi:ActR/RegA family two-component response regulator
MCSGTSRPAVGDVAHVAPNVVVLADDLIWATRLAEAITAAGAHPQRARRLADLERLLAEAAGFAIVDLTARAYDGVEAVRTASSTGARVVAVGQHDDAALRRAAMAAGAERVYTYRALFEDGPRTLGAWLAR